VAEVLARFAVDDDLSFGLAGEVDHGNCVAARQGGVGGWGEYRENQERAAH
jgi:hypothetical protein